MEGTAFQFYFTLIAVNYVQVFRNIVFEVY